MKKLLIFIASTFLFMFNVNATENKQPSAAGQITQPANKAALREASEFQKIIDEYKEYAATIPVENREEIVAYRKEIAALNKQKIELYRKLSQKSQEYLKKEREYKKKIPAKKRKMMFKDPLADKQNETKKETGQ